MTRPSHRKLHVFTLTVLLLLIASSVWADTPIWGLRLNGYVASGNLVLVSVTNLGTAPASATVSAEAVVGMTPIWGRGGVTLAPGQTAIVTLTFPGIVQSVTKVVLE